MFPAWEYTATQSDGTQAAFERESNTALWSVIYYAKIF